MSEEKREILEHLVEYLQDKIDTGYHKIFYNDDMYDEKTIDCINAINDTLEENKRLNNVINELENLIKEDIITNLCEIENKRIGYGQNETDKIWLRNLWGFKKYIINRCDEILKGSDEE